MILHILMEAENHFTCPLQKNHSTGHNEKTSKIWNFHCWQPLELPVIRMISPHCNTTNHDILAQILKHELN